MNKILMGLLVGAVFMSAQAHALSCEVSYKAKKVNKERYWFREVLNPKFKAGKAVGNGGTLKKCGENALKPLKRKNWEITYSSKPRKL